MMPSGTTQIRMSMTAHGSTPRLRSRYSVTSVATMIPTTMHSAYMWMLITMPFHNGIEIGISHEEGGLGMLSGASAADDAVKDTPRS